MMPAATAADRDAFPLDDLMAVVRRHWGFTSLWPLQEAAMRAVLGQRDSLVVLPTGGGKSLCYQAPAVLRGETTVVISPLISLMKDQVDALRANGVPAVQLNSSMSPEELRDGEREVLSGQVRLLFASPERMATPSFRRLVSQLRIRTFAIDEAHCISHWGHDFRPEYRMLSEIKKHYPEASVHAFTATATQQVRDDILAELELRDAEVLVGNFDRPNLTYRVLRREDLFEQILECVARHPGEAGIVYCIRRRDVDELTPQLVAAKIRAKPYHAGMTPEKRRATQNAFASEQCDVVVATVAFGMGIDRSNVRYVIHAGMPKSIEHYQQETGRAGRDGLEAECLLLYGADDAMTWRYLVEKSVKDAEKEGKCLNPDYLPHALWMIDEVERFCRPMRCRHRALVEYFGQPYPNESCGACDMCLGDAVPVPDAQTVAKKILSCVARVNESFGVNHVVSVLRGVESEAVKKFQHERLSTFGLLKGCRKNDVRDWVHQLMGQDLLASELVGDGEKKYPVLKLNAASWDVMKDRRTVKLYFFGTPSQTDEASPGRRRREKPPRQERRSRYDVDSWEGVDRDLFERLRTLRRQWAYERNVPSYVIFDDGTLRDLARVRPSSPETLRRVYGIGEIKQRDFGTALLAEIRGFCDQTGASVDQFALPEDGLAPMDPMRTGPAKERAFEMFEQGASIDDVMGRLLRSRSTVTGYLAEYIEAWRPVSIANWVDDATYARVTAAAEKDTSGRLKPIFEACGGEIPYDAIRLVLSHVRPRAEV
jgi:ATP-dependent DNA helicase RecQ